ncbi:MAG: hypothetical protein AB8B91_09945 [Rubripirellula sp.]
MNHGNARTLALICMITISLPSIPLPAAVPAVATSVAKAILKYFGKEGTEQATEYMSKKGGQAVMERVTANAVKQGGDEAVEQVAHLAAKHGPEALAALDNTPSVLPILKVLDELPEAQVKSALAKLAAGAPGRELAEGITKFGSVALRSELKHPGVGLSLVRSLGDDGFDLASKLTTDQAIAVGRHADDIAKLPLSQRQGVLAMLRDDAERSIAFIGRFVEANPGKTLFTVATTTVVLAEPDRILGGDEIVLDADGNPIVMRKAGLAGRTLDASADVAEHVSERYVRPVFIAIMVFVGAFAALWMAVKLYHQHRREKEKTKLLVEGKTPAEEA